MRRAAQLARSARSSTRSALSSSLQSGFSPFRDSDPGRALNALLLVNVAVFANWNLDFPLSQRQMEKYFVASTRDLMSGRYLTMFTAAFSHVDGWHLASNLVTLYFFGQDVFYLLGAGRAVALYLVAGGVASAAQCYQGARGRYLQDVHCIGASGAVSAFLSFSILTFPFRVIYVYMVIPVPALLFGALFVLNDVYGASGSPRHVHGVAVGHQAHLAGALVGGAAFLLTRGRTRLQF
jgi:membrane associated rhomboid family serine protease